MISEQSLVEDDAETRHARQYELSAFTARDQTLFGELSGDLNPVHMDANEARLTIFGRPVVHGVHLLLRVMETLAEHETVDTFTLISARFQRPVFLGEGLTLDVRPTRRGLDVQCASAGSQLATFAFEAPAALGVPPWSPAEGELSRAPAVLRLDELTGRSGVVDLPYPAPAMRAAFPRIATLYGLNAIAHLMATTYVVGMEVPGLHSMFATLSVRLLGGAGSHLRFGVQRTTPKISHVQIRFDGPVLEGAAEAFIRPVQKAIPFEAIVEHVQPGEFRDRKCLIVGGSRGLGLIAAMLLGAGGARVVLTYRVGKDAAEAAVERLRGRGIEVTAIQMDVLNSEPAFMSLASAGFMPTDVYYFATPHIFVRKKALFEPDILASFMDVYVHAFSRVLSNAKGLGSKRISIFYPSSEAVDLPLRDLAEYYVAKVAGEAMCAMVARFDASVKVVVDRLPRLPTDQTATLMNVPTADPATILIDICRRMSIQGSTETGPPTHRNV